MASAKYLNNFYSHNVQIYLNIPDEDLSRRDIEELTSERLNLLKLIDNSNRRGYRTYSKEWTEDVRLNLSKTYKNTFYKLCEQSTVLKNASESELEVRKMDYISHYILRLGYSTLNESQSWFVERETEWFYLRYQIQSMESIQLFWFLNDVEYIKIDEKEKEEILDDLCEGQDPREEYFKIKFKEAIDLIKDRKVYVKAGYDYVSFKDVIWCLMTRYKLYLHRVLLRSCKNLCLLNQNYSSLVKLVRNIINQEANTRSYNVCGTSNSEHDGSDSKREITISQLKKYSQHNFPLCMKSLYDQLKENHHLKYGSRIQLGNFVKAIGLSLDDSLKFWSSEFTHKMTGTYFNRNYAYHIKHMYGKTGRMKEYSHDKCTNITSGVVGADETHGCPFKTWDILTLTQKLKNCRISQVIIDKIVKDISDKQYQKACCKYFKAMHNVSNDVTIDSPLQYFEQSIVIMNRRKKPHDVDSSDSEDDAM